MHGLEAKYKDRMQFTYLDIDNPDTAGIKAALNYRVQPHFFLLDGNGAIARQWLGSVTEEDFIAAFEEALK